MTRSAQDQLKKIKNTKFFIRPLSPAISSIMTKKFPLIVTPARSKVDVLQLSNSLGKAVDLFNETTADKSENVETTAAEVSTTPFNINPKDLEFSPEIEVYFKKNNLHYSVASVEPKELPRISPNTVSCLTPQIDTTIVQDVQKSLSKISEEKISCNPPYLNYNGVSFGSNSHNKSNTPYSYGKPFCPIMSSWTLSGGIPNFSKMPLKQKRKESYIPVESKRIKYDEIPDIFLKLKPVSQSQADDESSTNNAKDTLLELQDALLRETESERGQFDRLNCKIVDEIIHKL